MSELNKTFNNCYIIFLFIIKTTKLIGLFLNFNNKSFDYLNFFLQCVCNIVKKTFEGN